MKTRFIWEKCRINGGKDSFFVECTDEDVVTKILPFLKSQNLEILQSISKFRGHSLINEGKDEKDYCNYFLISRDGLKIKSVPHLLPYSSQWNAYNPFIAFESVEINEISDLKKIKAL